MKIETAFSNGDKVWVVGYDKFRNGSFPFQGTVGQVRAVVTNSPGRPGEDLVDNFMPQKDYKEEYMLVERGIGSGSVFTLGKNIFNTRKECRDAIQTAKENETETQS